MLSSMGAGVSEIEYTSVVLSAATAPVESRTMMAMGRGERTGASDRSP